MKSKIESLVEHKELKQNGYSIHYYVSGNNIDKELIIFLHPAFADHRTFDKQIDYFSKHYRVVTIDLLGHGLSQTNKSKDKIDLSVNHIDKIIESEGYAEAHLVGVSMGSLIAQYYGLKNPEKVLSMTVLGGYDINADNKEIAKAQRFEQIKWIFKAIFSMDSFRRHIASGLVFHPEEQAKIFQMLKLFKMKSFMAMSGLNNILQLRENIKCEYPLLILCGEKDIELSQQVSKKWHDAEPTSKYFVIKNAGHCANMDNPEEFNKIVMDIIKSK